MADPSNRPSLTVLAGPQTGARFVFEDAIDNVLIGSDPSCRFCLTTPSVSPIHARIWIDAEGITVYDTNSPQGLYINDDRVTGHHVLRNGDVLWLGVPGDAESVMIQCVIPVAGWAPRAAVPSPWPVGEDQMKETVGFGAAPLAPPPPAEPDVEFEETMIDTPATPGGDVFLVDDPLYQGTTATVPAPKPVIEPEPLKFTVDLPASAAVPAAPALEVEIDETVIDAPAPPKVAPPPEEPLPPPTSYPAPPPRAARPRPSPPAPTRAAPAAPRPRAERAVPAPRRRAPPPPPPVEPEEEEAAEAPGRAAAPLAKYALLGVGALVLGVAAFLAVRHFRAPSSESPGDPAQQPSTAAAPTVAPPAATPVPTAAPTQAPAVVEPIEEIITILQPRATPPPKPALAPSPSPARAAAPTAAPGAGKAATPPPEVAKAQQLAAQVAGLLGQAEGAVSGRRYDAALGFYDEVLKLDPQNAQATGGKARAQGALAAAKRAFVPGRTLVDSGKSAKADLGGFDTSDVKVSKAPDYSGRLDFEVTPARVQPGDNYSVKVYLTNDGKKSFKIGGLTATIAVNGAKSGGAGSPQVKEVDSQQRVLLQDLPGVWQPDVRTWTLEVVVTTTHGESFRNTITWR